VLTEADLRAALTAIGVVAPVRAEEVTGSTNATALALAGEGAPEWTLVAAGHQTAGRGRRGRSWDDVAGRALLCSVVLRPASAPPETGLLSLLAGAAMAGAIDAVAGIQARCTWPNDLYVGESKVGGILAEAVVEDDVVRHVVLGVGVNLEAPAVAGAGAVGAGTDAGALLRAFLERFADGYRTGSLSERARATWLAANGTVGRRVRAAIGTERTVVGLAVGLDPLGSLLVEADDGATVTIGFGAVELLRQD